MLQFFFTSFLSVSTPLRYDELVGGDYSLKVAAFLYICSDSELKVSHGKLLSLLSWHFFSVTYAGSCFQIHGFIFETDSNKSTINKYDRFSNMSARIPKSSQQTKQAARGYATFPTISFEIVLCQGCFPRNSLLCHSSMHLKIFGPGAPRISFGTLQRFESLY